MELRRAGSRGSPTASWQAALQKGGFGLFAPREHLVARVPSGPPSSWTAFVLGSSPLPVISACSSQLVNCGTVLAIAYLGHIQQRSGSDLPQLWAALLHWFTSPGLPAGEVLEVTSHLVWTHQTTDDPRQLLGPRSSLSVRHAYTLLTRSRRSARRQAHRRFVVQALRHSAAAREQVDAAVSTFVSCFGRLWRVPWENGYKEVFWRLAVINVRAAGACQSYFSTPCPSGVVVLDARGDGKRLRQHALWECAIAQVVCTLVQRGLGGALLQQWHLWLIDPPPSVCDMVWRVVVLAAIWAMEQGRKRLWSLVHRPPRQLSDVQQAVSTSFWSALHDFAWHDRPVPS
jgi:hypothetical protein